MKDQNSLRISSIDILRALTMLLMIFVNDLWSLQHIPAWLEHTAAADDGMGLADTVFPAFLFIVGMSIPLSVGQRIAKGDRLRTIVEHIIARSVALLVMGLFLVNGESINEVATGMRGGIWYMSSCFCFILIWNSWRKGMNVWLKRNIRGLGIIGLCLLAWVFRGGGDLNTDRFATHWWGILGLIGWAYLVAALVYVLSGRRFWVQVIAWAVLMLLCSASHAGLLPQHPVISTLLGPIGNGAMPALTIGGTIITLLMLRFRKQEREQRLFLVLFSIATALLLVGFYVRGFWGISKIRATPAWILICSAITIYVFMFLYWLIEQKKKAHWFAIIKPAGTNTLLSYLLPYFAYGVVGLLGLYLPAILLTAGIGLLKSFCFALLMVILTGWLGKAGIRLKL